MTLFYLIPTIILFCYLFYKWDPFDSDDYGYHLIPKIFGWILNIFVSIILSMILLFAIDEDETDELREEKIMNIISLKNDSEVNGSFVLGSGTIGEIEYYYYFYNTINGYKRGKKDVSITYIKERNDLNGYGYLSGFYKVTKSRFGIFGDETYKNHDYIKYTLYVPSNTIVRTFKVE